MTIHRPKSAFKLIIAVVTIALIVDSCRKDNKTTIANPVVNQAREWYEATYAAPTVRAAVPANRGGGTA
jgi:hypothetical protein